MRQTCQHHPQRPPGVSSSGAAHHAHHFPFRFNSLRVRAQTLEFRVITTARRDEEAVMDTDGQQQQQQQQATHSIDLEAFAQQFSQVPVVVAYVFSFVSLHLVAALPQRLWRHVGCQITQLVMDTHHTAERRFWCGLSFADAFEWGRRLKQLKSIVSKYPKSLRILSETPGRRPYAYNHRTLSPVIDKIVTALVEGHSDGRRAAAATAVGRQGRSTLESIDISECESTIIVDEAEGRDIRAAREPSTAPLDPPLTLTSLTSIIIPEDELSYPGRGRHWQLPSLERVQVEGRLWRVYDCEVLGGLVATSRRLKELHVECHPDTMAGSLVRIPAAAPGQPGPLAQLEDIGTLSVSASAEDLEGLQAVLVDRGCRSIKKLSVELEDYSINSSIFATLAAIEAFTLAVCVSSDIVDIKTGASFFDLSLLCDTPIRPAPSFFVQRHIQQMAAKAHTVPAAMALARSLTFPSATTVTVSDQDDWDPDDDDEQPDPIVLDSMPHNAFPAVWRLRCYSGKGLASGRRLVTKMPVVKRIALWKSKEGHAVGMLQAVGGERELECFEAWPVTGVGEGGLTWGDIVDQLPTVTVLDLRVEVPEDLGDGDAAGEFGIVCVKSLLKIRGVKELKFQPVPHDAFKRLVEERTHRDTIEGLEGRYDISWRGYLGRFLTLKRLNT
ncbi:unnamed protein product [Vitrella brassicaformis CCMP3155]|uniref:Uncharacterized protein n=1 Tax=Vitrella brassicaformis (strain CCMP3155) TaxID=1169540 RepID=A0A0G4H6F1_VITBC|nr:unnamed protein product [Vitrella brassicaformis CCMP3155]|eukprot:CEM39416.1 unnamed protein product [Vitrella brassicaformis CCMP3155]